MFWLSNNSFILSDTEDDPMWVESALL